jgi:hypothetical protein
MRRRSRRIYAFAHYLSGTNFFHAIHGLLSDAIHDFLPPCLSERYRSFAARSDRQRRVREFSREQLFDPYQPLLVLLIANC